jgi:hypothetical protein
MDKRSAMRAAAAVLALRGLLALAGASALAGGCLACASAAASRKAYAPAPASPPPQPRQQRLFEFHSHFWVNLHHFARAVARGMPARAELTAAEGGSWDAGVALYRERYADRDLLFDDGMVEIKEALRQVEGESSLGAAPLDPELKLTLERLAPIYRAHWWPEHDAANRAWIAALQPLLASHGEALARRVAGAYGKSWPSAPVPVDVAVSAGPVGAYTTARPTHTTIASTHPGLRGLAALEVAFHEASHAWGLVIQTAIAKAAAARQKTVPPQLWHAVLFHTAGESTRRTLAADGIEGYVEYAVSQDVYVKLCGDGCRERVAEHWDPHLDGRTSIEAALDALVADWPALHRPSRRRG